MFIPYANKTPLNRFPIVTLIICVVSFIIYFAQVFLDLNDQITGVIENIAFNPANVKIWTLWTSVFFHDNMIQLVLNLWLFALISVSLEDRMGRLKFILFFALSAPAANGFCYLLSKAPCIGLTGCVFACIGASLIMMPWTEFRVFYFFFISKVYSGSINISSFFLFGFYIFAQFALVFEKTEVSRFGYMEYPYANAGGILFGIIWALIFYQLRGFKEGELSLSETPEKTKPEEREQTDFSKPAQSPEDARNRIEQAILSGDRSLLIKSFQEGVDNFPEFCLPPGPMLRVADIFAKSGKKDLALIAYERIIMIFPDAPVTSKAFFEAGKICSETPKEEDKAIRFFEEFLKKDVPLKDSLEAKRILAILADKIKQKAAPASSDDEAFVSQNDEDENIADGNQDLAKTKTETPSDSRRSRKNAMPLKAFGALKRGDEIADDVPDDDENLQSIQRKFNPDFVEEFSSQKKSKSGNSNADEDEENLSEDYNLILKKDTSVNINVICSIMSKFLKVEPSVVETRVKKGKGLLLTDISIDVVKRIKIALAKNGQDSEIVRHSTKTVFPKAFKSDKIVFSSEKIIFRQEGNIAEVLWDSIIYLSICSINAEDSTTVPIRILDVFAINPNLHIRITDRTLSSAQVDSLNPNLNLNFIPVVEEILKNSKNAELSLSLQSFLKSKAMMPKTFQTEALYSNFTKWEMLTLFGESII